MSIEFPWEQGWSNLVLANHPLSAYSKQGGGRGCRREVVGRVGGAYGGLSRRRVWALHSTVAPPGHRAKHFSEVRETKACMSAQLPDTASGRLLLLLGVAVSVGAVLSGLPAWRLSCSPLGVGGGLRVPGGPPLAGDKEGIHSS